MFFFSLGFFPPSNSFVLMVYRAFVQNRWIWKKTVRFDCQWFKLRHWTSQYRSSIHLNDFSKEICIIIWRDWQKESSLNDNLILNIKSINEIAADWVACEWNTDTLPHSHTPQREAKEEEKKTFNNIWQIYDGAHLTLSDRNGIHLSSFIHTMTTTSAKSFEHQFFGFFFLL